MWLILAFASAALLGCYDICKKRALSGNAVLPVLFFNTLISGLLFLPLVLSPLLGWGWTDDTIFYIPRLGWEAHRWVVAKAVIVLTSWIFGYLAMKHLPITIVGPINATRPVGVLIGAMLIFGERLNMWQWIGVTLAVVAIFTLSSSSRKEGIRFTHNKWMLCILVAALAAITSGLYDKFLMQELPPMFVQAWCNLYLAIIMGGVLWALWYPTRRSTTPFRWTWVILLVPLFLTVADFFYFTSLSREESLVSVVSMVRRSSVIISFLGGAVIFREKNVRGKAVGLLLILVGMIFLYYGSR